MLCVDTRVAAKIFNISTSALKEAVRRNSTKYKFVRLQNAGTRSRGGVKLLFGVDVTDMMAAINTKKCNPNVCVYVFKNGKYEAVEFTKILENGDEFDTNLITNLNQGVKNENKNGSKRSSLCYQRKEHEDGQDLGQLICGECGNCECAKRGVGLRCRRCDRFVDVSIKNDTKAKQTQKTGKNAINNSKNGVNHGCADASYAKPTQPTSANSSENWGVNGKNLAKNSAEEFSVAFGATSANLLTPKSANETSANLLTPTGANFGETSTNLSPSSSNFLSSHPTNVQIAHPTNTQKQTQDIKARIAYANTKKGAIALEKERILKAYERAKKSGVKSLNFIKNINANPTFFLKLSANKLFAWQRAYKESGFAGLIDERKSNRENIIDALGLSEIAQKFILSTDKKIDAPNLAMRLNEHLAVDMMDAKSMLDLYRADGAIISEGAARRFIASWRKNSANAIKDAVRRYGVDKTRGLLMPGYGNASWCAKSINEIVEIDATKLDLICTDELMSELLNFDERAKKIQSRFSIISMIDVYSRVRVFEICDSENTLAVQKCIAKYILTYGKPRIIHGGNGKAFLSKALQSACENLGIEYKKSKPYSGWQKPHIERSFGVLQNRLSAAMANYIGNDVARRKSLEGLYGMDDRRAKKGEKTRLKNLMDISEFERVLDEYCFSVIPNLAINSGDEKIIPLQRFNAKKDEAVRIDEAQLNALIGGLVLRSANGKKGISYGGAKFIPSEYITGQIYVAPNLNDISQIFIFDEDRNFICVGANLGSNIDASAAKKYQKAFESTLKKAQKQVQEARSYSQIKKLEAIEFASSNLPKIAPLKKINSAVGEKIKAQVQKAINLTKNAPNLDEYLAKAAGAEEVNAGANSTKNKIKSIRELIASGEI